jgi:hypothetical protein
MILSELYVCGKAAPMRSVTACGRMDVLLHSFSTSAVDGGQSSASRPGRCIPEERASSTNYVGRFVDPMEKVLVRSWRRYNKINLYRWWLLCVCIFHLYEYLILIEFCVGVCTGIFRANLKLNRNCVFRLFFLLWHFDPIPDHGPPKRGLVTTHYWTHHTPLASGQPDVVTST